MSSEERRSVFDQVDEWLDRFNVVREDDESVARFLDSLDLHGPRERELLVELARATPLADGARFQQAHTNAAGALESLGRHGFQGSVVPRRLWASRFAARFFVELVARYVVVSYLRQVTIDIRNIYWLREIQTPPLTEQRRLLRRARLDAEGMVTVFRRREIGLPSFVLGGLLIPLLATLFRLTGSVAFDTWWATTITTVVGAAFVLAASWVILHGAAMASRRIRLATHRPLGVLWQVVGSAGRPPRDQSRKFAIVAIVLTVVAWLVLPGIAAIVVWT